MNDDAPDGRLNEAMRAEEHRFCLRVDIAVLHRGLGHRLTDMIDWCRENIASGWWDQHGRTERRRGEMARGFVRCYFTGDSDAEAFETGGRRNTAACDIPGICSMPNGRWSSQRSHRRARRPAT